MTSKSLFLMLLMTVAISACSSDAARTVSLSSALAGITHDLTDAGALPLGELARWNGSLSVPFANTVRTHQCKSSMADPLIPVITSGVTIEATGTTTTTGGYSVTVPVSPQGSVMGYATSKSDALANKLTMPVQFITLSEVPNYLLSKERERLGELVDFKSGTETEGDKLLDGKNKLDAEITSLISSYPSVDCKFYTGLTEAPIMGIKKK